jgi:hypothetical protein
MSLIIYSADKLGSTGLDQEHNHDVDEELLLDFIISGITKDCTKTKISVWLIEFVR